MVDRRTWIKVCGVTTAEAARAVVEAGGDAVGLMFERRSPRFVTDSEANAVVAAVGDAVERVGVFTDHDVETIRRLREAVGLSMIQLHGEYGEGDVERLARTPVMRALHFDGKNFAERLREWDAIAKRRKNLRALLIDSPGGALGGGTGQSVEWARLLFVLDQVKPGVKIVLAGGLDAENIGRAITIVRPWGVDVSSGVEVMRGEKDAEKIRAFCRAVREGELTTETPRHGEERPLRKAGREEGIEGVG